MDRPEQRLTAYDQSAVFQATQAQPVSLALANQPDDSKIVGFDSYHDPLDAKKPMQTLTAIMAEESTAKPNMMTVQRELLERRYNLQPTLDPEAKMSRGKPLTVGPTARLPAGITWERLSAMTPDEIRQANVFPYPSLPRPLQRPAGQVFPPVQTAMFPRLERFDVEFDIPDAFLPEFPPAMYLQNRPESGDVSRGQVVSINSFRELFKDLLTPVQLEGLRLLLTPMPQEEFNATDDRKAKALSLGVACLDGHLNGHTTGQFHLSPDIRPQERRFRLDTVSLRGMFNQQIHGSKRSLRSVENFIKFEQGTAYFNGDPIHAMKKGFQELPRSVIPPMAPAQNRFDALTHTVQPCAGTSASANGVPFC